ncbi:hypothetical protein AQUCO_03600155v1, partial [Aquilegia coerulea]
RYTCTEKQLISLFVHLYLSNFTTNLFFNHSPCRTPAATVIALTRASVCKSYVHSCFSLLVILGRRETATALTSLKQRRVTTTTTLCLDFQ